MASALEQVAAAVGGTISDGQGEGDCPVCGKRDKFRFLDGDDGYLVLSCQSGACRGRSLMEKEGAWLSKVQAALIAKGVDPEAFRDHSEADAVLLPPEGNPRLGWFKALQDGYDSPLWGVHPSDLASMGVRWSDREQRVCLPVLDPTTGDLLTVIRRSLGNGDKKSKIAAGTRDKYLFAPFGIDREKPVILLGGEKDVLGAYARGFKTVACFTQGDGPPRALNRAHALQGCAVVVAGDVDHPELNLKTAQWLTKVSPDVRLADLGAYAGSLPDNGDAYDVLTTDGLGPVALQKALDAAVLVHPADNVLADIEREFLLAEDHALDHADALIEDCEMDAVADPEYVIDGWVPRGVYSILWGQPGVKKTFALLDMARSIRGGIQWQDEVKTQKGAVLFYQGEGLAQLKPRIRAWDEHHADQIHDPAPLAYLERFVDLTQPSGVAAIVRTVRGYEESRGCTVQMVVIDPLVEFMTGEENGEGMNLATKGLRALAKYLNIAVIAGHHANAIGDRARGAEFHRMRSGAFMHMEQLGEQVGIWQQKQKNAEALAVVLDVQKVAESLVLDAEEFMPANVYVARKVGRAKEKREAVATAKNQDIGSAVREFLTAHPGASDNSVSKGVREAHQDYSDRAIRKALKFMQDPRAGDSIRVEAGPNRSKLNYLKEEQ